MANKPTYVLGINGGVRMGYQDISAALSKNGEIIAAIEEERLNRIKHSPGQIPYLSIKKVLQIAQINLEEVDLVVSHGSTWGEAYESVLRKHFKMYFNYCPPINRVHHHLAHAASTYYASGFKEAMVLSIDASGDGISLQKAIGSDGNLEIVEQIPRTNSLGIYYSLITQFCGFTRDSDEYKLMGLAPYGDPNKIKLDWLLDTIDGGYKFNQNYIQKLEPGQPQPSRQQAIYDDKIFEILGNPRIPGSILTQHYKDVAAAAQLKLEDTLIQIVTDFHKKTGLRKLCLAGGVALNCSANMLLMNLPWLNDVYIQPAAGDNGISLGCAYLGSKALNETPQKMASAYLGDSYSNSEIEQYLKLFNLSYQKIISPEKEAAKLVAQGKVIGWFQGKMEFGPRALGSRSILASPLIPEMKAIINQKIKFREGFRPFCPSVLEEDFSEYFEGKQHKSPYMTINYKVISTKIPSATHVNGTARIQTVNKTQNPLFYNYLLELKHISGHGISLNTSFNRSNEPIVASPKDAVSVFYGSGLDALIIGNFLLIK